MLLEGMHLPLTTPFSPDGRLNLRKLEQNVARYSLTPAAGMVVLGATGEASLLSDEETKQTLKTALEAAAATKVMIAGVSRESFHSTLDLIEKAKLIGYDVALVHPPSSLRLTMQERRTFLQMIVDRSPLPILLTGGVPLDLVAELAFHPQILGFLGSFASPTEIRLLLEQTASVKRIVTVTQVFAAVTGRMSSALPTGLVSAESLTGTAITPSPAKPAVKTREKAISFQVLTAKTASMTEALAAGAVGAVPPFAAAAPQACYEVMAAWKDGDPALSAEKQLRLVDVIRLIEGELGVAGVKYGCDLNGYFGGNPRLPLLPLTGMQRAETERLMQGLKS